MNEKRKKLIREASLEFTAHSDSLPCTEREYINQALDENEEPPISDPEMSAAKPGREHLISTSKEVFRVHSDSLVCGEREYVDECLRERGEAPLMEHEIKTHHLREPAGPMSRIR